MKGGSGSGSDETEKMVGGEPHYGTFQGSAPPYPQQPVMGIPQPVPPPGAIGSESYYPPGYQAVPGYPGYPPPPPSPPAERPQEERLPCCGLGIGWLLFILGFIFASIPWYVGAFLLFCCRQDYREKPGLVACTIAAVLSAIAVIVGATKGANDW
ncbi:large ribosomal subunit protein eL20z [Cryptomeria japonica]|uniref:large ribosomal subunit protein eL20z n=1 Tax=Cryptomeria japonica TaxID=3369 RepID=UPI0027D9EEE9|nr:large ribosomal subunit protein eL20z [Cryptomeria japonica]